MISIFFVSIRDNFGISGTNLSFDAIKIFGQIIILSSIIHFNYLIDFCVKIVKIPIILCLLLDTHMTHWHELKSSYAT